MKLRNLFIIVSILLVCQVNLVGYVHAQGSAFTISMGKYPHASSYTLFREGSTYYAKNSYGSIPYSGNDIVSVVTSCYNNLPSQTSWSPYTNVGKLFFTSGTYEFGSSLVLNNPDICFELDAEFNTVFKGTSNMTAMVDVVGSASKRPKVSVKNICFMQDTGINVTWGLRITYATHYSAGLEDLTFLGCGLNVTKSWGSFAFDTLYLGGQTEGIYIEQTNGFTMTNCEVEAFVGSGITVKHSDGFFIQAIAEGGDYWGFEFLGCWGGVIVPYTELNADEGSGGGVYVGKGTASPWNVKSYELTFSGGLIIEDSGNGIEIEYGQWITIDNVKLYVNTPHYHVFVHDTSQNVFMLHRTIHGSGTGLGFDAGTKGFMVLQEYHAGILNAQSGDWIPHYLTTTPSYVGITPTVADRTTSCLSRNATHFQVGLYQASDGSAIGSPEEILWYAEVSYDWSW